MSTTASAEPTIRVMALRTLASCERPFHLEPEKSPSIPLFQRGKRKAQGDFYGRIVLLEERHAD